MTVKQIEGYQIFMSKVLGKGSYGSVYLGKKDGTDEQVAVKILPKDSIDHDDYLKAALKNEIDILQKVHSENIVGFYDVMESSKNYYIIQELCDSDLSREIKRNYQRPENQAIDMLRQLCNGFLALVKEGIIHRDLKPANIMKKGSILKLGDFGFAKQMREEAQMAATCVGTPLYMSLEVLKGESYTSKCDIWALGTIFFEILHGNTPWIANTEHQLLKNITNIPLNIKRKDLSPETQNFLKRSLQVRQVNRISWDEIFSHPIFKGYFISKTSNREFQNKLKMIMNKLRFYISKMNLDMKKIMDSMGFGQHKNEITFSDFYHFFQNAYPEITKEEADYCFKKTDTDNSGAISVNELKHMLTENGIKIQSQFDLFPSFQSNSNQEESFVRMSKQTSKKIKSCFQKLYKIIVRNNLSLWKVFNDFDKKKGSLNLSQFSLLLKKLCGSTMEISQEEIKMGFKLIDLDGSDSIEFDQLNKYYSKINGIPASMNEPPKQAMIPQSLQFKNSSKHRKQMQQQVVEPMSIQPNYPPQNYNQPQQNMQQGYPQQYPPQNFNQMPYQQNSGYQQPFSSQQYPQNYDNTMNYSSGNTGNFFNPNFGSPFNFQGNPNFPNNPNYPNNPNFNNNPNYSNQGQGFMGNQGGASQNVANPNGNPNFNPFELLKRI